MKKKEKLQSLEIQPLNDDVLANLSIEELEERLEMQILHMAEAQYCIVDNSCSPDCAPNCNPNTCTPNCNECSSDSGCGADFCYQEGSCHTDNPAP